MKLLYCHICHDARTVAYWSDQRITSCTCGMARARYIDQRVAQWNGAGALLALHNPALVRALDAYALDPHSRHSFTGNVIPRNGPNIRIVENL